MFELKYNIEQKNFNPNYFVSEAVVIDIAPLSRETLKENFETDKNIYDMDFVVTLLLNNYSTQKLYLRTNLFHNGTLPPNITHFLLAIDVLTNNTHEIISDFINGKVHPQLRKNAIGKKIQVLQYSTGTHLMNNGAESIIYSIWDGKQYGLSNLINTFDINTPQEKIIEAFEMTLQTKFRPPLYKEVK